MWAARFLGALPMRRLGNSSLAALLETCRGIVRTAPGARARAGPGAVGLFPVAPRYALPLPARMQGALPPPAAAPLALELDDSSMVDRGGGGAGAAAAAASWACEKPSPRLGVGGLGAFEAVEGIEPSSDDGGAQPALGAPSPWALPPRPDSEDSESLSCEPAAATS